jgi:hypothetical protein
MRLGDRDIRKSGKALPEAGGLFDVGRDVPSADQAMLVKLGRTGAAQKLNGTLHPLAEKTYDLIRRQGNYPVSTLLTL